MLNKKRSNSHFVLPFIKNNSFFYILLLIIVPLVLYLRVIYFDFTSYDDTNIISNNYNIIKNLSNIPTAFTTDGFLSNNNNFYRPLQTISFMIDALISGEASWAYHLSNIILHILCVVVLFVFLKQILIKANIAFWLSLLFAVHPILTHAVCWIPARGDQFLILFGLLSFIMFIKYFNSKKHIYLIYHSLFFILLCFSKETSVVLPFLAFVYFYMILKKNNSFKAIVPFLIIWGCSLIIFFILRNNAVKVNSPAFIAGIIPFLKNLPVLPVTFGKIFIPWVLTTLPLFDTPSMIIGISVFVTLIIIIVKTGNVKNYYLIFGLLWFICFTFPPMLFRLPLAEHNAEYYDHRAALPLIGILIVIGILLNSISAKLENWKISLVFSIVLIVFSILTWNHTDDYSDPLAFFSSAIKSNPLNAFALNSRAGIYYNNGYLDLSIQDLENSMRICPNYSSPFFNRGNLYNQMNDQNQAIYCYSRALRNDTLYPEINYPPSDYVYVKLSVLKVYSGMYDEAILLLKKAAAIDSVDGRIYNNLGNIYFTKACYDSAIQAYTKAIELEPNSGIQFINRGRVKYTIKDYFNALYDFNKAIELKPEYPDAFFYKGITKSEMGNYEGAISDFNTAISLDPGFGEAYYQRGLIYSKLNKTVEAGKDLLEAQNLGFKDTSDEK